MKTTTIAAIAAAAFLPAAGFAQTTPATPVTPATPATPVVPAVPGVPAAPDKGPKVPVTYLGIETSEVPAVVAEQLGLPKGFGLVVEYVVPDGPAAQAGIQQNDILKKLNDQILMEPDQLSKLIRSYTEGTNVTLTVLRKGAETTLTARLGKREVSARRRDWGHLDHGPRGPLGPQGMFNANEFRDEMKKLGEELGNLKIAGVDDDAMKAARDQIREAQREAREAVREVSREARERSREAMERSREAAREARDRAREMRVSRGEDGSLKQTLIDMRKAHIVYHDDKGELNIQDIDGKKVLTVKDPQGRLVFSGPITTKEELDKVPAEVRQRYEKVEQQDIPAVSAPPPPPAVANDEENDEPATLREISYPAHPAFPQRPFGINIVLI